MPDKDIDKIPITVEVPKADVWVRSDYRDIVRRLGEVHMIRACEHQHDDDWIPLYSIDVIAALQAEIERLQAELGAAEAFHRVAVAERNHERVITARLRADLDRFAADNQAAVRAYAAEINEAKAEIERLRKELEGEHQNFIGAVRAYAEEITEASGEIERLRTELGDVSEKLMIAGTDLAGARAEIERLREDNETLNEIIKVHGDEINRLRAERDDKRELLQQLRFIRTHLYAATVQRSPADDRIIADHVEQAYLRANEVIKSVEAKE